MFSIHLFTFTSWIFFPETNFYTSFKTISVYLADKQVELASIHCELHEICSFHHDAKSTNQQNKCQNCIFMEVLFQNDLYFTGIWTYQVRLPIPSMQLLRPVFWYTADNCNICIKIVIMFFCIEFQKSSSS